MVMSRQAAFTKVRGILEVAVRDAKWAASLSENPEVAIRSAGIDITEQELAAVKDIVFGTEKSIYATPPAGMKSMYPSLHELWDRARLDRKG